jgi:alanyl-tRNA synthetase
MKCDFYDCVKKCKYKLIYNDSVFYSCEEHLEIIKDFFKRYLVVKNYNEYNRNILPGKTCFELYSRYSYPLYLTRLRCKDYNVFVDELGYIEEMNKHRKGL